MKRNEPKYDERIFYSAGEEFPGHKDKLVHSFVHKNCDVCMHTHDFYEVNIVSSGKGNHYIGDMEVPLEGGEVFILPPNVKHGYGCTDKLDVEHILLRTEFLKKYSAELENIPGYNALFEIEPYLRQVNESRLFLRLDARHLEAVKKQIEFIRSQNEDGLYMFQTVLVLKLMCELCLAMSKQRERSETEEIDDSDILRVLEYIHTNYDEKLTINFLAKLSNMSRPTFHRRFSTITLMTPMEYIIKCRVAEAKKLLEKDEISRAEIAQKCGFYDTSHMNKYL